MRYDRKVYFVKRIPGDYDPKTGNYTDKEHTFPVWATVMDTGTDMLNLLYDRIPQGSKTLHVMGHWKHPDLIRIDGKTYKIDLTRKLRTKQTFIVSEVPE